MIIINGKLYLPLLRQQPQALHYNTQHTRKLLVITLLWSFRQKASTESQQLMLDKNSKTLLLVYC